MGNQFIYPIPKCSYEYNKEDPTLLFVPNTTSRSTKTTAKVSFIQKMWIKKIPCRYIQSQTAVSPHLIIFFHANSEDLGHDLSFLLSKFEERFGMNVICPEYPSYGIYKKRDDGLDMDRTILDDARWVIKYCHHALKYDYKNIILVGRSLGTAVAVRIASEFSVRGVVLISPFTAIRDVGKHFVGPILSKIIPDVFRSIDYIDKLKSPVLFIAGKADDLTPSEMAERLHEKAKGVKEIVVNEKMTHNKFQMERDVFEPIAYFMQYVLGMEEHFSKQIERFYMM